MGFFYEVKSKVVSFVADIRFYFLGFVLFGNSSYKVKGDQMRQILNNIERGDVLLRRYSNYLGSVVIPGYFSHAALYVGDNSVLHMLGNGIVKEDILTFMRCDDICILRPVDPNLVDTAVEKAYEFLEKGVQYDYNFDTNNPDRFYCTEFTDNVYNYPVKKILDRNKKILPDDFLNSFAFYEVYRTANKKA